LVGFVIFDAESPALSRRLFFLLLLLDYDDLRRFKLGLAQPALSQCPLPVEWKRVAILEVLILKERHALSRGCILALLDKAQAETAILLLVHQKLLEGDSKLGVETLEGPIGALIVPLGCLCVSLVDQPEELLLVNLLTIVLLHRHRLALFDVKRPIAFSNRRYIL